LSATINVLGSPYLWIALFVHQVARLGPGHEATSTRQELEEALEGVPDDINGFWYTADELKALGFSDALVAAMKDTTNNHAVNALLKGYLLVRAVETAVGAPSVRYFCRQENGHDPSNIMRSAKQFGENESNRPSSDA
jgi:hypothetical protein